GASAGLLRGTGAQSATCADGSPPPAGGGRLREGAQRSTSGRERSRTHGRRGSARAFETSQGWPAKGRNRPGTERAGKCQGRPEPGARETGTHADPTADQLGAGRGIRNGS